MKNYISVRLLFIVLIPFIFSNCTETYPLISNTYEEAIVIEATITNEFKKQQIVISKTARLEDKGIKSETGATVSVKDDLGTVYLFKEQSNGVYFSETEFKAAPNRIYQLSIKTSKGKRYESSKEKLTTENQIESIIPQVVTDKVEGRGVQIKVNSFDPTNTSKYYRYEYEETFKIIAPDWRNKKLLVTGIKSVGFETNSAANRICYTTKLSTDIILSKTSDLKEDRVDFEVRFISDQNYILSHRYSILVKQYVQNLESYTYRKTMKEISSTESILSPKQPGFVNGNIKCVSDSSEKAIGFFEVSSVSSKRIFFNYADLFPDERIPPYYSDCEQLEYLFCFGPGEKCRGDDLIELIRSNTAAYYGDIQRITYFMVPIECGDCTSFSNNKIPQFWID